MNPCHLAQFKKFRELMRICSEAWELAETNLMEKQ